MMNTQPGNHHQDLETDCDIYVRRVLESYRSTPGTTGQVRRHDRLLAAELHRRGVPLSIVKSALLLAAVRRVLRPPQAPPLDTIRSLHYFLPVIDELIEAPLDPDYVGYLQWKLGARISRQ
jgi:hypothetical protein